MPAIRALTFVSFVAPLVTFQDPRTLKPVLVTTDEGGAPTAVMVDGSPLTLTATVDDHWTFTGTIAGALWQIDLFGAGDEMTGRATTRS